MSVSEENDFISFYSSSVPDYDFDIICEVDSNRDVSQQRIRLAASGYDIWESNPLNKKGGDPGKRKQIFDIICR